MKRRGGGLRWGLPIAMVIVMAVLFWQVVELGMDLKTEFRNSHQQPRTG
jgi:hypothetical protein